MGADVFRKCVKLELSVPTEADCCRAANKNFFAMITEEQLRESPRDELERLEVLPLAQRPSSTVVNVMTAWNPNDLDRRSQASAMLRRFVGPVELYFLQPLPDPSGYIAAAIVARYEGKQEPSQASASECSVCGEVRIRRVGGKRATLCIECLARCQTGGESLTAVCDFCDFPRRPIYGTQVRICEGCMEFWRSIDGNDT